MLDFGQHSGRCRGICVTFTKALGMLLKFHVSFLYVKDYVLILHLTLPGRRQEIS